MNFNKVLEESWKRLRNPCLRFAEITSSYSDPEDPIELWISGESLKSGRDALAILALIPFLNKGARNYFQIDSLRRHLAKMAEWNDGNDWITVREILTKTDSLSVYPVWSILLDTMSESDWFGNFLPLLLQKIRGFRVRKVYSKRYFSWDSHRGYKGKKKVFRRGYDDKGTLRPNHKWLPKEFPEDLEERIEVTVRLPRDFQWFGVRKR